MPGAPVILVSGFEPYGPYKVNPSAELAATLDGRAVGPATVRSLVLPVHRDEAAARLAPALDEAPLAVVLLGLAAGRARLALERVALNVLDYPIPDAEGVELHGPPCVPGGPPAYWSRLPLEAILAALTAEGVPAYISNTAGTYLCNQTMYWMLHALAERGASTPAGLIHVPLLPAMVAATGTDEPSMDFRLLLRAVEIALGVVGRAAKGS
jgi:pyroglutamyl-peptidase